MFKRLFGSALCAGLIAGLIGAGLQQWFVVPLILEGERYEQGFALPDGTLPGHDHQMHRDAHDYPSAAHWQRVALTVGATTVAMTGFALLLVVGFAIAEQRLMRPVRNPFGLLWGMGLFAAVHLAPALGLAPELPGAAASELGSRQLWWLCAALASALAMILVVVGKGWRSRIVAIALAALPHIVGAPMPEGPAGVAPPELAALFASRTLVVGAIAFCLLGWLAARFWSQQRA